MSDTAETIRANGNGDSAPSTNNSSTGLPSSYESAAEASLLTPEEEIQTKAHAQNDQPTFARTTTIPRPPPREGTSKELCTIPATGETKETIDAIDSPAFLQALRSPPLPHWAAPYASRSLTVSRLSLLAARSTASTGFAIARTGTLFGFSAGKLAVGGIAHLLDHALGFNGNAPLGQANGPLAQTGAAALQAAEKLALMGINIGSGITELALTGVTSTIALLEDVYGNDEALRTLEAFTRLVRNEWNTSLPTDPFPEGGLSHFNPIQVAKAAATWAALQSVTGALDGKHFAMHLDELDWGRERPQTNQEPGTGGVLWEITDDQLYPSGAEITEATINNKNLEIESESQSDTTAQVADMEENARQQMRRFASMCLGSYGSAGVIFFGVKLPSIDASIAPDSSSSTVQALTPDNLAALARQNAQEELDRTFGPRATRNQALSAEEQGEEDQLGDLAAGWAMPEEAASAVEAIEVLPGSTVDQTETTSTTEFETVSAGATEESEDALVAEDWGLRQNVSSANQATGPGQSSQSYDLWGLVTGKHDEAILHSVAGVAPDPTLGEDCDSSDEEDDNMSRTDARPETIANRRVAREALKEARKRKALKGRRPPRFFILTDHPNRSITVLFRGTTTIDDIATDLACESSTFEESLYWDDSELTRSGAEPYTVHGGMFEIATAIGNKDGPVHRVVEKALRRNEGYSLQLNGHSLGAGIASLLGLMWTNPNSATISSKSGLPKGRSVQVFGFATPCVTDAALSMRCRKLIHSFVYSFDVVPRFSLGHMRDIRSAAAWLCYANADNPEESCDNILKRIVAYNRGSLDNDLEKKREEEDWFNSIRTTLEANQGYSTLFPPGDVLWLTKHDDLTLPADATRTRHAGPRLFRVNRPDIIYKQIIFTKNMLSSHLPHQYTRAIEEYL